VSGNHGWSCAEAVVGLILLVIAVAVIVSFLY
jgi:hypothetical protein